MNLKFNRITLRVIISFLVVLAILSLIPVFFIFLGTAFGIYLLIVFYLINLLALIDLLFRKYTDLRQRISWTIVFVLIPGAGSFIYFIFSYIPYIQRKKLANLLLIKSEEKNIVVEEDKNLNELFLKNYNDQNNQISKNSDITFLMNDTKIFSQFLSDLKSAKNFINIQYPKIVNGIFWNQVEEILIEKLKLGVKINILVDYDYSFKNIKKNFKNLTEAGANFAQFNKLKLILSSSFFYCRSGNKFVIIDNKISYFSGINPEDIYLNLSPNIGAMFDLDAKVTGELVQTFNNHFVKHWEAFSKISIENSVDENILNSKAGNKLNIQFFTDGLENKKSFFIDNFLSLVNNSKKQIRIVTPNVIIPNSITTALSKAVHRGVNVEIIISGKSRNKLNYYFGKYFASQLIYFGIKVYRVNDIYVNSKFYLFDEELILFGTTSLNYKDLFKNFESNLLIQNKAKFDELNNIFILYRKNSYLEKRSFHPGRPYGKFKFMFVKFFSSLI